MFALVSLLCCGVSAAAEEPAPRSSGTLNSPYADRYAASKDLSEFILQRAALPAEGSYFYAYLARWECNDDAGIARRVATAALSDPDVRRVEATKSELERCRNVTVSMTTIAMQRSDVEDGRRAGDRLFAPFRGDRGHWYSAFDDAELQKAFAFFAQSGDPGMVWVMAQQLAGVGYRMLIDGKRLSQDEGRALYTAFMLGACDRGIDCGPSHRWRRTLCIQDGLCDDGLETAWRRGSRDEKDQHEHWERVGRYRTLIGESVRRGDWSRFALTADPSPPS